MKSLLDEREAASYLDCSVALMRKWRTVGGGPAFVKLGALVRYSVDDLNAFIAAHRTGGGR